ncbi:MAG TPA: VWA domain-containing protein, partial [Thermoanaerobaculia bacterium]|nr:VWA domain-containing protein [Thermoanaerobaculia bacterium]
MTFRSADLLWLLAAFPVLAMFLATRERHRMHVARRFASERLRGVSNPLRPLRPWLLAAGLALSVVAIAGPRWGVELTRVTGREPNRIILIDVSSSMAATDVGTSRLGAAKAIARWI